MKSFTKPVPPKPMPQISQPKTLIRKTAFSFIAAKTLDHLASRVA
jgi:hypothetical protein